jgi:hypothetical protein
MVVMKIVVQEEWVAKKISNNSYNNRYRRISSLKQR